MDQMMGATAQAGSWRTAAGEQLFHRWDAISHHSLPPIGVTRHIEQVELTIMTMS
jgi:hypothetical protein